MASGGHGLTGVPVLSPGLKPCPMVLVFGCRQSRIDHIYKEETLFAKSQGVFRELYTAYSREPDKPKVGMAPAVLASHGSPQGPCRAGHAASLASGHSSLGHENVQGWPFPAATNFQGVSPPQ